MKSLSYLVKVEIKHNSGNNFITRTLFENPPTDEQFIETIRSNYMVCGDGEEGGIEKISAEIMECTDNLYFEEDNEE